VTIVCDLIGQLEGPYSPVSLVEGVYMSSVRAVLESQYIKDSNNKEFLSTHSIRISALKNGLSYSGIYLAFS